MTDNSTACYQQAPSVKIIFVGDASVGKTSIINIARGAEYTPDQLSTICAAFYVKKMEYKGQVVRMHVWDTAGQERFGTLSSIYYRQAAYVIIVYAINNEASFTAVRGLYKNVNDICEPSPKFILVGNKGDLESERVVTAASGRAKAERLNARFYETSAVNNTGTIHEIFEWIVADYFSDKTNAKPAAGTKNLQENDSFKKEGKKSRC